MEHLGYIDPIKINQHVGTLPKTNIAPKNDGFQQAIFRGYVSFREGKYSIQ